MVRITRVYTRTGDGGTTQLVGGQRVDKDSSRIEAYGTVDELNAVLGVALAEAAQEGVPANVRAEVESGLRRIQNELFNLGSDLATRLPERRPEQPVIEPRHVQRLEQDLDRLNAELPMLRSFVLPGGSRLPAWLHLARTVCRRAERAVVRLAREEDAGPQTIPYLNRLSDYLFVLSRWVAREKGEAEPLWTPEST